MFKKVWTRLEGLCCLLAKKVNPVLRNTVKIPNVLPISHEQRTLWEIAIFGEDPPYLLTSCGLAMYCFKQLYCSLCCLCLWNIQWMLVIFRHVWWSTSLWSRWLSQQRSQLVCFKNSSTMWDQGPQHSFNEAGMSFRGPWHSGMGGLFIVLWRCQQKWWSWLLIGLSLEM